MNLPFTPRGQDHDIETNQDPEAVNLNFQALYREHQRLQAQLQAYQIDLSGSDVTGKIPPSRLGGATPPDITKFYREDGIFAPVSSGGGGGGSDMTLAPFRRRGWSQVTDGRLSDVGCVAPLFGATFGFVVDAAGVWQRCGSTNAIGAAVGQQVSQNIGWLEHLPIVQWRFRTGSNITNFRFLASLTTTAPTNVDVLSVVGLVVRYSTVAGDTGFTPIIKGSGAQVIGAPLGAFTANTHYLLEIKITNTTTAIFTLHSGTPLVQVGTTTMAIPADALGRSLGICLTIYTTDAVQKSIDLTRLYFEVT